MDHKTKQKTSMLVESKVSRLIIFDYRSILSTMSRRLYRRVLFDRPLFFLVHASSATLVVCEVPKFSLKFCDDYEQ